MPLITLARDGTDEQKEYAAGALQNLAVNEENKVSIARAGGMAPHSATLSVSAPLASPTSAPLHRVANSEAGGIVPLVALASNGTDEQKVQAAAALWNLAVNAENQVAIARAGEMRP